MGSLFTIALALAVQVTGPMGGGTQPGELSTPLVSNTSCQLCHRSDSDERMPGSSYRGTMMDLAGVDPIFLAALEIASNDAPDTAELCLKCHYPRAWLDGRTGGSAADGFGLEPNDLQGIQCDYCHRMAIPPPTSGSSTVPPPELSGVLIANAQVFLHDSLTKQGPFGSTFSTGHLSAQSPLFSDSVLCAQCHDVSNTFEERIGDDGQGLGEPVPIERTYTEWRASAYADPTSPDHKTCMECHMQPYVGFASTSGSAPERALRSHKLVGANTMAPRMVAYLYDQKPDAPAFLQDLGPDVERTVAAVREQLGKAAVLEPVGIVESGGARYLRVRVTNLTGHKLPTGYAEGRRMFLSHEVSFGDGGVGPRSGTIDESTWEYLPGEEPVRTYEILMSEDGSDDFSFHFALVRRLIKDNRIPPKGFRPTTDTPILQHDYPTQPDGTVAHWDEVDLPLSSPGDGNDDCWPATVKVGLWFQSSSGKYLRFLVDNAPVYGPDLASALEAVGAAPEPMESFTVAVFPDGRILPPGPHACEPLPPPAVVDAGVHPPPTPDAGGDVEEPVGCACGATDRDGLAGRSGLLGLGFALLLARRRREAYERGAKERTRCPSSRTSSATPLSST